MDSKKESVKVGEIKIFKFKENEVRTVEKDNNIWWVAKDICDVLSIQNTTQAIQRLDEDERAIFNIGRQGETNIINESGLYSLILRSDKPKAKDFKKWVTSEILPSIRKMGQYSVNQRFTLPQTFSEALRMLADKTDEAEALALINSELQPKAGFFDDVMGSDQLIDMSEVAKVLARKGFGRNNLFEFLRNEEVLMQDNAPYQRYIDNGWFKIVEVSWQKPNGDKCFTLKTMVYQKGVDGIRKLLSVSDID